MSLWSFRRPQTAVPGLLSRSFASRCLVAGAFLLVFFPSGAQEASVKPSSQLAGIAHVAFRTTDLDASRAFYEKLGFMRAFELTKNGKPSEEFIKINDRQFLELYPKTQPADAAGLMHVCYQAVDLAALQAAYTAAGLAPPPVKKAGAGNLLFSLRGPDGQVIEFTQYMPGSMHSNDHGQHLGEHRISQQLTGVTLPVRDTTAFAELFTGKLQFLPVTRDDGQQFKLPGDSGESIGFVTAGEGTPTVLHFAIGSPATARKALRAAGLSPQERQGSLRVADPDGNIVMLTGMAKHQGR